MADTVGSGQVVLTADTTDYEAKMGGAQATAKQVGTVTTAQFGKISSASGAMAAQVGGSFGQVGAAANSALRPMLEVGGALGAIGASAAGVLIVAKSVTALAAAASDSAASLKKMGIEIGPEATAQIASYDSATKDLGIAFDQLAVAVGGELAGDLASVASAVAGTIRGFIEAKEAMEPYREVLELIARSGLAVATLGATELARATLDYAEANNEAQVSAEGLTKAEIDKAAADKMEAEAKQDQAMGAWAQAAADKEAAAAKSAAAVAEADAAAQHETVTAAWIAARHLQLDTEEASAAAEIAASQAVRDQYLADNEAKLDSDRKLDAEVQQILKDRVQAEEDASDAKIALITREQSANVQAFATIASSVGSLSSTIAASYQARVDAGEELSRAEVAQANSALNGAEAAAIATAGVQAAIVAASAIASLQAVGTPPPIAIGLGIAEGAGLFAATVAGIRAHRPPEFSWHGQGSGGNSGSQSNTGVLADTDGDGQPDDNSKPTIDPGGDRSGQTSRGSSGGSVSIGFDATVRQFTLGGRPGKAPRRGGPR